MSVEANPYKSALLLEADLEEEIDSLSLSMTKKKEMMEKLLRLPEKISYDCLVPLSKVAFTPGRLIHTNEFNLEVESGERQWMSHVEAANEMEKKMTKIREETSVLKSLLHQSRGRKVQESGEDTENSPKSDEYVPLEEEVNQLLSTRHEEESDDSDSDIINDNFSEGKGFEIREYCDRNGNVLDSQIVDLSKELLNCNNPKGGKHSNSERPGEDNYENTEDICAAVEEKLNIPSSPTDVDQESLFVRELAEISTRNKKKSPEHKDDNLEKLFNDLEHQEIEAAKSEAAAAKGLLSSSTWKKGFLSGSKENKKTLRKKLSTEGKTNEESLRKRIDAETAQNTAQNSFMSSNIQPKVSEQGSDSQSLQTTSTKKKISRFKQNRIAAGSTIITQPNEAPNPNKAPFSGGVVEKFA